MAHVASPLRRRPIPRPPKPVVAVRRLRRSPLTIPLIYAVGGVLTALVLLAADRAIGAQALPAALRFGEEAARSLATSMVSGFLFVVSVVFWVRVWALQMSAGPASSRMLREFLTDTVQIHAMGFIVGVLAYTVLLVRALPGTGVDNEVPQLALWVLGILAVVVAAVIVFLVHNAATWGQIGRLIRWLTDACLTLIRTTHPQHDEPGGDPSLEHDAPAAPTTPATEVRAQDAGWIQRVDERALLTALPPGATAELAIRVGNFVTAGDTVCCLWSTDDTERAAAGVQEAIVIGPTPTLEQDLSYGIRQLADIAERAMAEGANDSTTAQEVVLHLGIVLRELLTRDLPAPLLVDDQGRRLLLPHEEAFEDFVASAFDRIRAAGAGSPALAVCILETLARLVDDLERRGFGDRTAALHDQARAVLEQVDTDVKLEHDRARIRRRAVALRLRAA